MCKGGGGTIAGDNNRQESVDTHISKGNLLDEDHGFTMVSIHLNTLLGSVTGTLVVLGVVTCLIVACSGPLRQLWRRMRGCYRMEENTVRNEGGRMGGTGMEMQTFDRCWSDYQLNQFGHMNPYMNNTSCVNKNMGNVGKVRDPPSGTEAAGGCMTPM